jgi:hypothetical protein
MLLVRLILSFSVGFPLFNICCANDKSDTDLAYDLLFLYPLAKSIIESTGVDSGWFLIKLDIIGPPKSSLSKDTIDLV